MNRFRTKKKAKDDSHAGRSSEDSEHTALPSFKSFRKGKKAPVEEPKKEIDLTSALPSNDDFRTSLLMTNLSARFSMLREQDDPNTKIGKASDDSVLYPKRQSRMADFGFSTAGLGDIAEDASIKGSPFLKTDSFVSDDADSKGVMNRSKATEGNNLFGGRQKIYKIPAGSGGLTGRALYDDDVSMSAFQRWRQAERERERALEEAESSQAEDEADHLRADSPPPVGYNRKRETSSTTSSASVMARNSTAATSVVSQPTSSVKDWQSVSTAPTSASSTPVVERSVTRTRRLYEQGLTQDMQDQQSSAVSRIDSLTRQRKQGPFAAELGSGNPSPSITGFLDRHASEKRTVLAKSSAPNLRSLSPPTTGSSLGTMDLAEKPTAQADNKPSGSPPLSPPVSETGDLSGLPIQPNDLGKATALGVFQKPSQGYNESKYAQRQIQLQRGRETPTQRMRAESNASAANPRSRSSSAQRQPFENRLDAIATPSVVQEEVSGLEIEKTDTLDDLASRLKLPLTPQVTIERPSDKDHPAFRQSALPTPLSLSTKTSSEPSPVSEKPDAPLQISTQPSPEDSPTLGPTTGGLSGLVRQHLRSESNSSSIYGGISQATGTESRFPPHPYEPPSVEPLTLQSQPWTSPSQDWGMSFFDDASPTLEKEPSRPEYKNEPAPEPKPRGRPLATADNEADDFANQLAEAKRRVREKLTSYVESDSSRAASPSRNSESRDNAPQLPSNPLGLGILKPKSSKGSLADRTRTTAPVQSKVTKMLGLGGSTMATSPSPNKASFEDERGSAPLATMEEVPKEHITQEGQNTESDKPTTSGPSKDAEERPAPPGLQAFRQARMELQRQKELESLARHQLANTSQSQEHASDPSSMTSPRAARGFRQRTPSRERKPPPVLYRQRAPSDENGYPMAHNSPRNHNSPPNMAGSDSRDRSDSEASQGRSASNSRPPRLRNPMVPPHSQLAPGHSAQQQMLRSPGLPGTDIRRSPIMPPQGYAGRPGPSPGPSPHVLDRSRSANNLQSGHPTYDSHSGQPSPISPLPPASPFGRPPAGSPSTASGSFGPRPRQPSAAQQPGFGPSANVAEAKKRFVDKREISEPTFVMSTSRVPTMNLPHSGAPPDMSNGDGSRSGSRSRSNSRSGAGAAPPLPPINPRRRRETSRPSDGFGDGAMSAPHPPYANQTNRGSGGYNEDNRSAFSVSDDEDGGKQDHRRRLRKVNTEAPSNSSFLSKGPPTSRTTPNSGARTNPNTNVPGGMF